MVSRNTVAKLRTNIEEYVGKEICITANVGRNRCISRKGVIEGTYPSLFVFKENDSDSKLSYSYADVITNILQINLPNGEEIFKEDYSTPKYTRL